MDRDQAETVGGIAAGAVAVLGWLGLRFARRRPKSAPLRFATAADYDCLEGRVEDLEQWRNDLRVDLKDMEHSIENAAAHAQRVGDSLHDFDGVVERELRDLKSRLEAVLERLYALRSGRPGNGERQP